MLEVTHDDAGPLMVRAPDAGGVLLAALTDVLRTEQRLLHDLDDVLRRQGTAVAAESAEAMDECMYDAQRVMFTLGAARRRRQAIVTWLGHDADLPLRELVWRLGAAAPAALQETAGELEASAVRLAAAILENRRIVRRAMSDKAAW
jgi:hypothetical protein